MRHERENLIKRTVKVPNATSTDEVALTPAESINQAMHPEGVRMNAGGNTYNWNNVQGNQTQNINNDNRSKIQEWIDAPNPSINFNAAYNKMTKGTGVWLLEDSRFNEWKDEGGLLWLQGKAGSGKTFLCTKAIFSISAEHQVVYFYFDTLDQTKSKGTYQGMLSSLMLDKPSTTCIFIDAMDECQASDQHLVSRLILDLVELGSKIHMFVSCRHTASTVGISSATYEISLNEQVVESDIQRHIEQVFQDRPLSVDVHKEVTEALAHGAHGQIRWVDCQIQQLQELGTRTAILTALKNLPDDLEETYCQALVRVNKHHQKDVEAILKWLLFGYEELKLELLPEILRAASYRGREEIVKLLVEKGADINAQGGQYGNALQAASYLGREEIVKLLVEKGADINASRWSIWQCSPGCFIFGKKEEIVKLLVEKGADINAQGGYHGNALQAASLEKKQT
ncbi:hypothetical protein D9758_017769 [Tetrapyrgos nigripes]|uniref:Nephrocystin 3-like N-terminal domain-containing protein n=1 Tax=Tetrapyrgos nigripes TaxID=182062 RepID=A0A8H5C5Q4_9AGAR|nr:hypothetical protein D9758_017769 [Tetrapyrgos nigripes]